MANISSAAGTATITARNRAEALQVLKALDDRFSVYDYYTSYNYDVLDTVSQLPRPIKGPGLAKGPIPLYLSVVCSSCIWS